MPSAPQAGQRALSLSASGIMTSNTFIKGTGILQVLPLGLLLLSLLVSGSQVADASITAAANTSSQITTSTNSEVSATSATTPSPGMTTSSTETAATMSQSTTSNNPVGTSVTTTTHSSSHLSVTGGMALNGTTMSNDTSKNMIYCPSFSCNYSNCYSMYTSQNTTPCAANDFCQLLRQTDLWYSASCSKYCGDRCMNISQTNCTVNCCNSTGCLNYTFASMMMVTTTVFRPTTTASPAPTTTTTTTTQPTTANKGNRCNNGTCTGTNCYASFNSIFQMCSSSQPHCQLKNESTDSTIKWTIGCTNCTGYTACTASAKAPCHLECCNATMNSCLWLNGTLNVPSFATRGPYIHTELIVCLLCVVAITFLL